MLESGALIMSAVALVLSVMTLPTTLQKFFGGPRLKIDFTNETFTSAGTGLHIEIHNAPIEHWFLKRLEFAEQPPCP